MGKRDFLMKQLLLPFLIFAYAQANTQEIDVKEFFSKYFVDLDISKHYSDWIKDLERNSSFFKYEFRNPELNDSTFINYKIKKHPLIADDSTKAFLSYKLRINIDTIAKKIVDSVFIIHLYFIYGKGEVAKQKRSGKFKAISKETKYLGREYRVSGNYYGYSYDLGDKPDFPYLLSITLTKNKAKEYILRLSYFFHYKIKE
jgi:hypothetical protein